MPQLILRHFFYFLLLVSSIAYAATDDSSVKTKWGYEGKIGPKYWGQLSEKFSLCETGKTQSPINMPKTAPRKVIKLKVNYESSNYSIIEEGQTDLDINGNPTIINNGHTIQVNFHEKRREQIVFDDQTYKLLQFHFHAPSETLFDNQSFPAEIHFVHQGKDGKVAVLGVVIKEGKTNAALQNIITHLPEDIGVEHNIASSLNPAELLPERKVFFNFMGSLTTPPCSEGLNWIVLQQPIEASAKQIAAIKNSVE